MLNESSKNKIVMIGFAIIILIAIVVMIVGIVI